jgi:type IV secretion system protein TrbL
MSVLLGLPAVPTTVCPSAAGALGGTGLGAVCSLAGGVTSSIGSAVGSAVGFGVGSVLDAVSSWVTGGAVWLLGQIGGVLSTSTAIDLGAPWFAAHYATMAGLAGVVIVPLLLLGVVQALYRQSATMLLRSVLVHVPLAILLTAVAVTLVRTGLAVTDSLCAAVSRGAGLDAGHFLAGVTEALAPEQAVAQPGGAPTFVLFLGGIAIVVGAVMVWLELLLRSAAVYVAVLFLPLALAGLAWPAIAHWSRRLVDTLAALVLSKLVIVAVLSLAAGALAGGTGSKPSGATGPGGGFASVLGGAALLLMAAFAPWSLFRLLPFIEAGAVGHLEGLGQRARHQAAVPARGLATVAMRAAVGGSMATGAVGVIGTAASGAGGGAGGGGGRGLGAAPAGGPPGAAPGGGLGTDPGEPFDPYRPDDWGGPQPWEPGGSVKMMPPRPGSEDIMDRFAAVDAHFAPLQEAERQATLGGGAAGGGGAGAGPAPSPTATDTTPVMPAGVTFVRTLPRQSGAVRADHLGRDHLGPVLVAGSQRRNREEP